MERELYINPRELLVVTYSNNDGIDEEVLAAVARYVPVQPEGKGSRVVFQVRWDPAQRAPSVPYYCPRSRLKRLLIAPAHVKRIRPYVH